MAEPWPGWAGRWYGILFRILVALCGVVFGLYLILIGYYTAVDWKTGVSNWTTEAVFFIVAGILFVGYSLFGAIRPTKLSLVPPVVGLSVAAALAVITFLGDMTGRA